MRSTAVLAKTLTAAAIPALLMLAGCKGDPAPAASLAASDAASSVPDSDPAVDASEAPPAVTSPALDTGALTERRDPERLLRYYSNAIRAGDWASAAKAWSLDAQMTPEKLANEFGDHAGPKLAVGKGDSEGAAGTLYYEAPVVIDFGDGRASKRGTIVLSRVNDVPGASEEQLNWRIERTSTLTY